MHRIRRAALLAILALAVGCTSGSSTTSPPPSATGPPPTSTAPSGGPASPSASAEPKTGTIIAQPVATDLDHPATFVVAPDGSIFYGERLTGEIRRIDPATGKNTHVFTVPGVIGQATNEEGLVGLTVPPDFPHTPWLYAYASRMTNSAGGTNRATGMCLSVGARYWLSSTSM